MWATVLLGNLPAMKCSYTHAVELCFERGKLQAGKGSLLWQREGT